MGGVRGQSTKKKLLSEDRTFEQALKVAQADELAEKESKLLYTNTESIDVNQPVHACTTFNLKSKAQPVSTTFNTSGKKCFRCDSTQHLADKCSYVNATCYSCHKKGHLSKACFKRKKESEPNAQTNLITTTTIEVQDQENFLNPQTVYMHSVNTTANTSLYKLAVNIEDANVEMEIDTGSAVTLLNTSDFKKVGAVLVPLNLVLWCLKATQGTLSSV